MSHAHVFRVAAAVMFVFGLALLLAPQGLVALYGAQELNRSGLYNSMLYGAALLGYGWQNWLASGSARAAVQPIVLGNLAATLLGLAAALYWQLTDPQSAMGWLNVAVFALLAMLFAGVLVDRRNPGRAPVDASHA